ncbi:hypothetical protein DZS_41460 [Dickeya ananatis]
MLAVNDYSLDYALPDGSHLPVLRDITLHVNRGDVVGLVGESGSGKTTLGWAIMRWLASNARERAGEIHLGGLNLRTLATDKLHALRGGKLGMIFQDPSASLNPTLTLGGTGDGGAAPSPSPQCPGSAGIRRNPAARC